ncbi:MAG: hypothetical protein ACREJ2_13560 [Planctomycetota bacterium]
MRYISAMLLLSLLAVAAQGCSQKPAQAPDDQPATSVVLPVQATKMPVYTPNPIPIMSLDPNENARMKKLIEQLTTTLHDDVKWQIIEFGPRAIGPLIAGVKSSDETALRKDSTRAFVQHDMGDVCDELLREMIIYHSNYAGEELPARCDYKGWVAWWSRHQADTLFYSPKEAERASATAMAQP